MRNASLQFNPRQLRRPLFVNREHATRELMMFAEHTAALYDARTRFERLIKRQIETGKYEISEGRRLWRGWFDHAAVLYEKEFGGDSHIRFPDDVRDQAAKEWEEHERQYIAEGSTAAGPLWKGEKPNPIAKHPITRIVVHQDKRGFYAKVYDDRGWLRSSIGVPGATVDRAYIEKKAAEFWPGVPIEWPNPLARQGYGRRKALNSDLERYYSKCMTGSSAKRFRSHARRESYCSAVSWKIARNANRYPDYFRGVKRNPMLLTRTEYNELRGVADGEGWVTQDQLRLRVKLARMGYLKETLDGLKMTAKGRAALVEMQDTPMPMMTMIKNPIAECPCENPVKLKLLHWAFRYGVWKAIPRRGEAYNITTGGPGSGKAHLYFVEYAAPGPARGNVRWSDEHIYVRIGKVHGYASLYLAQQAAQGDWYKRAVKTHQANPILTDARGVPFDKPRREDYRSDTDYMRAFYRYKDAIRDEANRSFNTRFMQTVRRNPLSTPVKAGLAVAGVAFVGALIYAFTKNSAAASNPPGVTPPNGDIGGGMLTFTTDPLTGMQVIRLAPGNMGSITVTSQANTPISSPTPTPSFNINAPTGGRILNVVSSNTNVLFGMAGSTTTSALSLGSANLPGTTLVTVSWTLNGAPVTSTFIVIAT